MSTAQVVGASGAILLGAIAPGPDFVIMARNSIISGRRAGLATGAGAALGIFVWAVLTGLGVAGLLAASATAFTVVKLIGAAYLVFLGLRALLAARRGGYAVDLESDTPRISTYMAFRQGLLNNLLNPKAAVFYVALLPQFLPAVVSVTDSIEIGVTAATVTGAWYTALALGIGTLRRALTRNVVRRAIDATVGTVMIGLGMRIALQTN
ncbi:LysE family translocator [Nocardia sp. CA-135953]|uniref:LysE family translocator n=1 Tax=Nocardia sp. CA-135953 TaxID=3239978 RepID=UPI003D99B688